MWDQREDWEQLETTVFIQKNFCSLSLQTVPLVVFFTLVLPHILCSVAAAVPTELIPLVYLAVWRSAPAWDVAQYSQHQDSFATFHFGLALLCKCVQSLKMCFVPIVDICSTSHSALLLFDEGVNSRNDMESPSIRVSITPFSTTYLCSVCVGSSW